MAALTWRGRRQLMYYAVGALVAILVVYVGYQYFFSIEASCRNQVLDPGEQKIDCGGVCTLVCQEDARAPVVLWARTFKQSSGQYTAAAYVQNNNPGAGSRDVGYTFQLFDADNQLVTERRGTIDIPPAPIVPILETNIDTGTRDAVRALFAFTDELRWERPSEEIPVLHIKDQRFDGSKITGTLVNDSRKDIRTQVTAVLFDAQGVARGASKSAFRVGPRTEEFIVFTFAPVPPGVVRAELTVLPPF